MAPRIVLIGDVGVDVTLTQPKGENRLRLGGIMHAARTLWALGVRYDIAYICPDYLVEQTETYAGAHGTTTTTRIGVVTGAPNVVLVGEPTEAGPQGYEVLLRDDYAASIDSGGLARVLNEQEVTDVIIYSGKYDLDAVLSECGRGTTRVHIDLGHDNISKSVLAELGRKFDTAMISTSSPIFTDTYGSSVERMRHDLMADCCSSLLFKENRGGTRLFVGTTAPSTVQVGAQVRSTVHSVGVGDCFDAAYVALVPGHGTKVALSYASWIAAEYASTTYPDDFRMGCSRALMLNSEEVVDLEGISVPWEARHQINVYIAAPDFDYMDRSVVDAVAECLTYHNFLARLPIRENGQLGADATADQKRAAFDADMLLLKDCQMVVAVMTINDPGTICEIGVAAGLGVPVIVYDPYDLVDNPMVMYSPDLVSSRLDEVIGRVFVLAAAV